MNEMVYGSEELEFITKFFVNRNISTVLSKIQLLIIFSHTMFHTVINLLQFLDIFQPL